MGVGARVGVAVGSGVEVTVGTHVSTGRGVASGCGGVLIHAANPPIKKTNQDHFATFTPRTHT